MDFSLFENRIGFTFNNKSLLSQAFTHRSYLNESRSQTIREHNERLEFLGDAVLELVVTEFLYAKYPEKPEGDLTAYRAALVNTTSISDAATKLGMNEFLLLSRGEAKDTGRARQIILANAFEALIGAIYLDHGYKKTSKWVLECIILPHMFMDDLENLEINHKNKLYGWANKNGKVLEFETSDERVENGRRLFTIAATIDGQTIAEGKAFNKKDASQIAAQLAVEKLGIVNADSVIEDQGAQKTEP